MNEKKKTRRGLVWLVFLLLATANGVSAQQVSQATARSVAETFFSKNVRNGEQQTIQFEDITAKTSFQNFYIFSADSGFVLVAADERVTPILGYSKTSPFVTEDMPENLRWWLEGYDRQIQEVKALSISATPDIKTKWSCLKAGNAEPNRGNRSEELFLMTTKWNQNGSSCTLYNNACPVTSSNQHCVTGCTATAIAQVLKYWNHPIHGVGSKTLTLDEMSLLYGTMPHHPECYPITANFAATTYDWQHMPDQLTCSSSQVEKDAIATLMLHCGVAMSMNYGELSEGSNAPYRTDSLIKYFDYSPALHSEWAVNYDAAEWINMLKHEIDAHRPVLYGGRSSGGAHAFVLYGYDDNEKFLVNWGWSGQSDDYYEIGGLNPPVVGTGGGTTYDFNEWNEALLYLLPNDRTLNPPSTFNVYNTTNYNELQLQWSPTLHAGSYVILRNGRFLAETSSTSYIDDDIISGSYTYQVITIGENHRASLPSGSVTYTKPFIVTTTAVPVEGGTTMGDGHYPLGESCTVTAIPNLGMAFLGWYNDPMGLLLVSHQPEYTFTVTGDRHLYANFILRNYAITTSCSPTNGGTVTGDGSYMAGSTVTLTATANTGYVFSCWTENGEVISTQPTYSFQALADRHLVANFMNQSFAIGNVITNPDGSQGVVFYINPTYTGGCMVALEDVPTTCPWGSSGDIPFLRNYTFTKNECLLSDLDGYANTAVIRDHQSANANYASGKVDYGNGWYVPSAGQLRKIYSALPFIEQAITNAGGTTLAENANYWSSTENSESNAWTSAFEMISKSKTSNNKVRAVHDFSINNTLHVQLRTNNAELGAVVGTDFYPAGSQVTVMAVPSGDNLFRGWTENGHLVSQDAHYTFTVNANRELVANFAVRGGVGTLVTNPDGSQGILFHLNDDGTKGLMVALEDASEGCQWGPANDVVILKDRALNNQRALEDQSGFHNTQLIRMMQGTNNGYAASLVDFDNGWYLPSSGELRKLYATFPLIEEALIKAGGTALTDGKYWSSTEYSASYALTPGFEMVYTSKTSNCRVRAIRNYVRENDYTVLVAANNDSYGTVSVTEPSVFAQNQIVTVTATPKAGYQFDHWTEDGARVSYDATYQFPFTRSRSLMAHFVVPGTVGSVETNADGSRGVVFYTDPSGNSLMVALEDVSSGCAWGTNQDITALENLGPAQTQNMLSDMNGHANTQIIRQWQSNNTNYAAGKVDFANDWYLPSAGQLRKLYAALPLIEEAIVSAGGALMTENLYWSSSENSSNYAWSPSFEFTKTSKTSNLRVRAIRNFECENIPNIQTIVLSTGWNWFSTYIEMDDPVDLLDMLKESLGDNGLHIESSDFATDYLGDGEWFGDLDDEGLSNEQMYLIETNANCTVELQGVPTNPAYHAITIYPGYNWIGFPCFEEVSLSDALADFDAEEEDMIESNDDSAVFFDGEWIGLENLVPGQGYLYFSNSDETKILVFRRGAK